MVMKGTTPRSLGWAGSLGALALAGILLPVNPIWAQKDEVIEFKTAPIEAVAVDVAKIDKDAVIDIEADAAVLHMANSPIATVRIGGKYGEAYEAYAPAALEQSKAKLKELEEKEELTKTEKAMRRTLRTLVEQLEADASTRGKAAVAGETEEPAKPWRIYLGYSTTPTATREMAVTGLVERLQAQAKQLLEKENPTDAQKEWARKAHAAAEKLEELAKTTEDGAFSFEGGTIILSGPPNIISHAPSPDELIKRGVKDPQLIKEAHDKRVEFLQRELASQQRRVAEMGRDLAAANRRVGELRNELIRESGRGIPNVELQVKGLRLPSATAKDQDRLDQLEGKLSKVLEELESLKKQKSEAGPRR